MYVVFLKKGSFFEEYERHRSLTPDSLELKLRFRQHMVRQSYGVNSRVFGLVVYNAMGGGTELEWVCACSVGSVALHPAHICRLDP